MSVLKIAAELFVSQLGAKGDGLNLGTVVSGLQALLPTTQDGNLDLASLVSQLTGSQGGSSDLAALAGSFLGKGGKTIDVQQVLSLLGQAKVDRFANHVGVDGNTAASGLAGMLPKLLEQGQSGGLLGNLTGSTAKGMLGKLFQ